MNAQSFLDSQIKPPVTTSQRTAKSASDRRRHFVHLCSLAKEPAKKRRGKGDHNPKPAAKAKYSKAELQKMLAVAGGKEVETDDDEAEDDETADSGAKT